MSSIRRGQIYRVFLDPAFGHEMGGYKQRPVVVLSINDINTDALVVSVVPGTRRKPGEKTFRNVVPVEKSPENGLAKATSFHCHQVRALDKGRFVGTPIGTASETDLKRIEEAVKYSLGLSWPTSR